jgi:hypothetical protein
MNDLAVQAVTTVRPATEMVSETTLPVLPPQSQPERAASPSPITNLSLRLDLVLGLVVMEFRNNAGAVTTSIPSQRQLQAYQKWDATHFGPVPAGVRETGAQQPEASAGK